MGLLAAAELMHAHSQLHNTIDRAIQVFGAAGLTEDTPLRSLSNLLLPVLQWEHVIDRVVACGVACSQMYRHARAGRIYDGPDEVHVQNVALMVLSKYAKGKGMPMSKL
jgi:acyl-CoA dehydrogenase